MGVAGSGKSVIGAALARALGVDFVEGDDYHSPQNVDRMSSGVPLTDEDRAAWLSALAARISKARKSGKGLVVSCSALKRSYRDILRAEAGELQFIYLRGPRAVIVERIAQRRGHLNESERLYAQASDLAAKAGDVRLLSMIEQNLGVLLNMRGNLAGAEARYSHSLGSFDGANDEEAVSWVLNNIGMLYTKLGHYQRAIETLERGLAIAKARNDALVESILTLNLAEVWVAVGKLDQAEQACRTSLESASSRGDHLTIAGALKCRARIERERGAYDASIATLRIAIFEAEGLEDRLLQAEMLREFGQTSRALGNPDEARLAWKEAAESFEDVGARDEAAEINALLASLPVS
jgi:gluconokinase